MADARPQTALPDRQPALRVIPMPADANQSGDIFGGWIMAQVDLAGAMPAMRLAAGRVATDVLRVGRTSITVSVEVYAQHRSDAATAVKVTEAVLTYVAVDENRRPRVVTTQQ